MSLVRFVPWFAGLASKLIAILIVVLELGGTVVPAEAQPTPPPTQIPSDPFMLEVPYTPDTIGLNRGKGVTLRRLTWIHAVRSSDDRKYDVVRSNAERAASNCVPGGIGSVSCSAVNTTSMLVLSGNVTVEPLVVLSDGGIAFGGSGQPVTVRMVQTHPSRWAGAGSRIRGSTASGTTLTLFVESLRVAVESMGPADSRIRKVSIGSGLFELGYPVTNMRVTNPQGGGVMASLTASSEATPTATDVLTPLPSPTPTAPEVPTSSPSSTPTPTPSDITPTPSPTLTPTPTETPSPLPSSTPSPIPSPTPSPTTEPTPTPSSTPSPSPTPSSLPPPTPPPTPSGAPEVCAPFNLKLGGGPIAIDHMDPPPPPILLCDTVGCEGVTFLLDSVGTVNDSPTCLYEDEQPQKLTDLIDRFNAGTLDPDKLLVRRSFRISHKYTSVETTRCVVRQAIFFDQLGLPVDPRQCGDPIQSFRNTTTIGSVFVQYLDNSVTTARELFGCGQAPLADVSPLAEQTFQSCLQPGMSVTVDGRASDPAGLVLDYKWTLDGAEIGSETSVTFPVPAPGTHALSFTAKQRARCRQESLAGPQNTKTFTVKALPSVRITAPAGDQCIRAGTEVGVRAEASDPDGRSLTYEWRLDGQLVGVTTNVTLTVPPPGEHTLSFTTTQVATSPTDCHSSATAQVRVFSTERPEVVITAPGPGSSFVAGIAEFAAASATSPMTSDFEYHWSLDGQELSGDAAQVSFIVPQEPGVHTLAVRVRTIDNCPEEATATVPFEVLGPQVPTIDCWDGMGSPSDASSSGLANAKRSPSAAEEAAFPSDPRAPGGRSCTPNSCNECNNDGLCGVVNDPVAPLSGQFVDMQTDFAWSSTAGRIFFERVYLSSAVGGGNLGPGWSHNWHRVLLDGCSTVSEISGRGTRTVFRREATGYAVDAASRASLLKDPLTGDWVVTRPDGTQFRYNAAGRFIALTARGNTIRLEYTLDGLSRIVDPAGTSIDISIENDRIRTVRAKNGQTVQFAYDAENRFFVATDTAGKLTTYSYEGSSSRIACITRPTGDRVKVSYNAAGRVTQTASVTPSGREATARYEYPLDLVRRVIDAEGRGAVYTFNAEGRLVRREEPDGRVYVAEVDTANRITAVTHPGGKREAWTYDSSGALTSHTDLMGKTTVILRNPVTGFPETTIRPDQTSTSRTFDSGGLEVARKDANGREVRQEFDSRGLVIRSFDEAGRLAAAHDYNENGDLIRTTNAKGEVTSLERDTLGRVVKTTSPGNRVQHTEYCDCGAVSATEDATGRTTYEFDDLGRQVAVTVPGGARTTQTWERLDGRDYIVSTRDAMGNETLTERDASGRVVAHTVSGRRTTYVLDAGGRVIRTNHPGGDFTLTRYTADGRVFETENALGAVTRLFYDDAGRVVITEAPDGSSTGQTFDGLGRLKTQTNQESAVVTFEHDPAGQQTKVIDPLGQVHETKYTSTGAVERTVEPGGRVTRFEHDELDRTIRTIDALNFSSSQEYSPDGEVTLTVNARGARTRFAFDQAGRLVESTDAQSGVIAKRFDDAGNLVRVEDEEHHAWQFAYDLLRRRVRETDPNGKATHYEFQGLDLVKIRHPDGATQEFIYEPQTGRLTSRVLRDRAGRIEDVESFGYNIVGDRTRAENGAVRITSAYDEMRREVKRTTLWKKTNVVRELNFSWDAVGRRQAMRDHHGRITLYRYDKLSRPISVAVLEPNPWATGVADTYVTREYKLSWDVHSNLEQVDYPNGTRTRREFDATNRLTKLVHQRVSPTGDVLQVLASWDIERDKVANPIKVVREDGETWTFEHDLLDRLIKVHLPRKLVARLRAKDPARGKKQGKDDEDGQADDEDECERLLRRSGEVEYRYDKAHNRNAEVYAGEVIRSTFTPANEQLTRGTMGFSYDERGHQTEKRFRSGRKHVFGYNAAGKLASLSTGHVNKPDKLKAVERYLSAPGGERVLVEDVQGGLLTHSLWDGSRAIEEFHVIGHGRGKKEKGEFFGRDLGGQLLETARYTRWNGRTANECANEDWDDWDDDDDRRGDGGHSGPQKTKLSHVRWAMPDFLGSTALVTNHRGRVLDRLQAGPWGEPLEGNYARVKFGYTGHRVEERTGHWSALHRQLDPRAGRWTQRDPLGDVDGQNRYAYATNRPLSGTDPFGLKVRISKASKLATTVSLERVRAMAISQINGNTRLGKAFETLLTSCKKSSGDPKIGNLTDFLQGASMDVNVIVMDDETANGVSDSPGQTRWDGVFGGSWRGQPNKSAALSAVMLFVSSKPQPDIVDERAAASVMIHEMAHWAEAWGHGHVWEDKPPNTGIDTGDYIETLIQW